MSLFASFLVVLLLFSACGSSQEKSEKNNTDTSEDTVSVSDEMRKDTIPSAPLPEPAMPPGQAKLQGKITEIADPDSLENDLIKICVREVLKYGPSTQPIVVNDTLVIHTNLKTIGRKIDKNEEITAVIQQNISTETSAVSTWSLIKLEN